VKKLVKKVFLYSDTTDVYFSSQVENQVMGKFELEYIFIEGKAKRVLFLT